MEGILSSIAGSQPVLTDMLDHFQHSEATPVGTNLPLLEAGKGEDDKIPQDPKVVGEGSSKDDDDDEELQGYLTTCHAPSLALKGPASLATSGSKSESGESSSDDESGEGDSDDEDSGKEEGCSSPASECVGNEASPARSSGSDYNLSDDEGRVGELEVDLTGGSGEEESVWLLEKVASVARGESLGFWGALIPRVAPVPVDENTHVERRPEWEFDVAGAEDPIGYHRVNGVLTLCAEILLLTLRCRAVLYR